MSSCGHLASTPHPASTERRKACVSGMVSSEQSSNTSTSSNGSRGLASASAARRLDSTTSSWLNTVYCSENTGAT